MSLNKFMHPRNKYRKPPDFKALAIKYPEFRKHAKQDISGKVSVDFKNLESLHALTCTLLKEDFGLDVEIPMGRLVPTLPLRLNYLLWIEDLLQANNRTTNIRGIDIGCGASCIYPLLAAKHFKWQMLATEVDVESAFIAGSNIRKNKLQDVIKIRTVEDTLLVGILEPDVVYDFCMCNPPFFSSAEELDPQVVSRSPHRHPPRNAQSGTMQELVAPGGETAFINKIIQDSVKLKDLIRVYSVMVGHKTSVNKVKADLREADITLVSCTEFCQGHTTRWGVAWTLDPATILTKVADAPTSNKQKTPFTYSSELDLPSAVERLQQIMTGLQIKYSILKNNSEICAMEITAMSSTWLNSRKRRRQEKLKPVQVNEIAQGTETGDQIPECCVSKKEEESEGAQSQTVSDGGEETTKNGKVTTTECTISDEDQESNTKTKNGETFEMKRENKRMLSQDEDCSDSKVSKRLKADAPDIASEKKEPILFGSLVVKRISTGSVVELFWVRGVGGRNAAYQVLQYFKNNLKTP